VTSSPIVKDTPASSMPKSYPTAARATPTAAGYATAGSAKSFPPSAASKLEYTKKWGEWEEMWDEENQAYYFFNHGNGDSAWERPTGWPSL